ncbi:MAG TPA: protein kinase, partial [Thermoanaerobaculia bacterium]|nr:protein kinase [Thermoanaerobaculia bacterium]
MTPERWRVVDAILHASLTCEPAQRDAFVAEACGNDEELLGEVASLLAVHNRTGDFLNRPAAEILARGIAPPSLTARLATALAGRYQVEREVGRGGMATVHLARDLRHGRWVAIKVLREELAAAVGAERFLEEIRVTASLQHPHILPLFDSGSAEGLVWYVMPFVEGETLRSRLARERRLSVDDALQLVREMADALEYAHRHGVVHRDVKPENVLLQSGHALVADFGIALALENAGGARLTRTGITLGTPSYMAPEQAAGDRPVDARTDVYALGAVLHEMLAGESPFAAASHQEMRRNAMDEPVVALAARRADISSSLDAAVRRALANEPDDRFPSAGAFAAALAVPLRGAAESGFGASSIALPVDDRLRAGSGHGSKSYGRMVSARAALYAVSVVLAAGLVGGWALARSPIVERVPLTLPDAVAQPIEGGGQANLGEAGDRDMSLTVVDRSGRLLRTIAANRPWTPRFSPDGQRVAYGAFGNGRNTSDLWVTDLDAGTTRRLTDDGNDSNDPQWSTDGATVAYSVSAPDGKDLEMRPVGAGHPSILVTRAGTQFASDWLRDGSALLVTEETSSNRHDILVQPADGSAPRPYAATSADETAARVSPDGRWVAYTSDESGRLEVYLDSYPQPGRRVSVTSDGGAHPVWRGDGRELYYWNDGRLLAVRVDAVQGEAAPAVGAPIVLFRARYYIGPNTMYDVSPDG